MDNIYICHHGVKGMKWGRRNHRSTGIASAIARRSNKKVDDSFKDWKKNDDLKKKAIESGKKRNESKMLWESNRSDKTLKKQYSVDNKQYKKDLKSNTTYRKGSIKSEVGKDLSRKYLSKAKQIDKALASEPNNRTLKKDYNRYMSKHDVERARARRAPAVAEKRMRKIASLKRKMTIGVSTAVATAAVTGGLYATEKILGRDIKADASGVINKAKRVKDLLGYINL